MSFLQPFVAVDGGGGGLRMRGSASSGQVVEMEFPGTTLGEVSLEKYYGEHLAHFIASIGIHPHRVVLTVAGLPGSQAERESLLRAISEATNAQEVWLTSDSVGAHCSAITGNGVVIAVGTGVAALAVGKNQSYVHELSGDGYLIGDEGGAYWQGRSGLNSALRYKDGRGGSKELLTAALSYYETSEGLLADCVTQYERPVHKIAGFAPIVSEIAEKGDRFAIAILDQAAEELSMLATTAHRICGDSDFIAVLSGGAIPVEGLLFKKTSSLIETAGIPCSANSATNLDGATTLAKWENPRMYAPIVETYTR